MFRRSRCLGVPVLAALVAFGFPAHAQETGTAQIGNFEVSFGGGTALLTLPDVPSLLIQGNNAGARQLLQTFKSSDDFGEETGWNIDGSIEAPLSAYQSIALRGFWSRMEGRNSSTCTTSVATVICVTAPLFDPNPAVLNASGLSGAAGTRQLFSQAERDVDHWGIGLETKRFLMDDGVGADHVRNQFVVLGAGIRGIDQDISENINDSINLDPASYREDLDTRYYGLYIGWGGDYDHPLLSMFYNQLGIETSFLLRGGLYYADTDYSGQLTNNSGLANSALSLSSDDAAFIGGVVLETRRQLNQRTTLTLRNELEYYSYVPEMAYNQQDQVGANTFFANGQNGTVIGNGDAFSARTMLMLKVRFGPDSAFGDGS